MTSPARFLPTASILNFRDYGGYAAGGGGRVRTGHLFRSSDHSSASDDDLALVDTLDLSAIIDLRNAQERAIRPSRQSAASRAEVLHTTNPAGEAAPHVAVMSGPTTPAMVRDRLIRYYSESPFRDAQRQGLRLYFHTLDRAQGPTLVHCAAGKDRTGVAVAFLLAALGVGQDDILADYLLTNKGGSLDARMTAFAYSVSHHFGSAPSDAVLRAALSVEPDYLAAAFAAIRARCGGITDYLETALDIDASRLRAIAERLIV